jgi:hypothetical protein
MSEAFRIGPWRIPIAGVFQESRDERGLVLTRPDGEQIVCRFVPGERPTERGEGARRRLAIVEELERRWLNDAYKSGNVVRRTVQVRQRPAGRTMMSMVTERSSGKAFVLRYAIFDSVNQARVDVFGAGSALVAAERYDPLVAATRSVGPTTFR